MKKYLLILLIPFVMMHIGCKTDTKNVTTDQNNSNAQADDMLKQYEKEGFIDKNTYVTLFIKAADSDLTDSEIEVQIKKRAQSSLRKTLQDIGKQVNAKSDTKILNLINDNGKILKLNDNKNSRQIFVLEIKKENLKQYITEI